jgi:hypothetical protein
MNGDILNKVLMERLDVTDIRTGLKTYHVHGVQRIRGTTTNIVLYNRIGKTKVKVMELTDFIKNFNLAE